nr:TIGR04076 family protein [Pseudonocardia sp. C8]
MNYSACAMAVGDHVDIDERGVHLPPGQSFCYFAIAAVAGAMSGRPAGESLHRWAAGEPLVACPDPPEDLIMRVRPLPEGEDDHDT